MSEEIDLRPFYNVGCVLTIISTIILFTLSFKYKKFKHHSRNLTLYRSLSDSVFGVNLIVLNLWKNGQHNCHIFSFFTQFSLLSSQLWYLMSGINLLLGLTNPFHASNKLMPFYHIFAWGLSFISALELILYPATGWRKSFQTCWIMAENNVRSPNIHSWALFFGPSIAILLFNIAVLLYAVFTLSTGLPETLKARTGVLHRGLFSILGHTWYWVAIGVCYYQMWQADVNQYNQNKNITSVYYAFAILLGVRGVIEAVLWLGELYFQRGKQGVLSMYKTILDVSRFVRSNPEDGGEDGEYGPGPHNISANLSPHLRNHIADAYGYDDDGGKDDEEEEELDVARLLRREVLLSVMAGIKESITKTNDDLLKSRYSPEVEAVYARVRECNNISNTYKTDLLSSASLITPSMPRSTDKNKSKNKNKSKKSKTDKNSSDSTLGYGPGPTPSLFDTLLEGELGDSNASPSPPPPSEATSSHTHPEVPHPFDIIHRMSNLYEGDFATSLNLQLNAHPNMFNSFTLTRKSKSGRLDAPAIFTDMCPFVFHSIRTNCGWDSQTYLECIINDQMDEQATQGRSGAFFFYSNDKRLIVKSLTWEEASTFLHMLPFYYAHITSYPESLLCRYLGLHLLTVHGRTIPLCVMRNILQMEVKIPNLQKPILPPFPTESCASISLQTNLAPQTEIATDSECVNSDVEDSNANVLLASEPETPFTPSDVNSPTPIPVLHQTLAPPSSIAPCTLTSTTDLCPPSSRVTAIAGAPKVISNINHVGHTKTTSPQSSTSLFALTTSLANLDRSSYSDNDSISFQFTHIYDLKGSIINRSRLGKEPSRFMRSYFKDTMQVDDEKYDYYSYRNTHQYNAVIDRSAQLSSTPTSSASSNIPSLLTPSTSLRPTFSYSLRPENKTELSRELSASRQSRNRYPDYDSFSDSETDSDDDDEGDDHMMVMRHPYEPAADFYGFSVMDSLTRPSINPVARITDPSVYGVTSVYYSPQTNYSLIDVGSLRNYEEDSEGEGVSGDDLDDRVLSVHDDISVDGFVCSNAEAYNNYNTSEYGKHDLKGISHLKHLIEPSDVSNSSPNVPSEDLVSDNSLPHTLARTHTHTYSTLLNSCGNSDIDPDLSDLHSGNQTGKQLTLDRTGSEFDHSNYNTLFEGDEESDSGEETSTDEYVHISQPIPSIIALHTPTLITTSTQVLKDLDVVSPFIIDPDTKQYLLSVIHRDAEWLYSMGLVDYSLLVGTSYEYSHRNTHHYNPIYDRFNEGQLRDGITCVPVAYTFGLIDIFTLYDCSKRMEHITKTVLFCQSSKSLSAVRPAVYAKRFHYAMDKLFTTKLDNFPHVHSSQISHNQYCFSDDDLDIVCINEFCERCVGLVYDYPLVFAGDPRPEMFF